ncbi:unnamed protein product, partial [Iphiclides podalirius]
MNMNLCGSGSYMNMPPPVPKMPPGLMELMEGLTKEVLKNNPSNVHEFCAEHMWKLLELRDNHPQKKYLTLDQKIYLLNTNNGEESNVATFATAIETENNAVENLKKDDCEIANLEICSNDGYELKTKDQSVCNGENDLKYESDNNDDNYQKVMVDHSDANEQKDLIDQKENKDESDNNYENDQKGIIEQSAHNDENASKDIKDESFNSDQNEIKDQRRIKEKNDKKEIKDQIGNNNENNQKEMKDASDSNEENYQKGIKDQCGNKDGNDQNKMKEHNDLGKKYKESYTADKLIDEINIKKEMKGQGVADKNLNAEVFAISENDVIDDNLETIKENQYTDNSTVGFEVKNKLSELDQDQRILERTSKIEIKDLNFVDTGKDRNDVDQYKVIQDKEPELTSKTSSLEDSTKIEFNIFDHESGPKDENGYSNQNQILNKDKRAHGISRMDTVLQTVNEEKSLSLSTDDSSTLSSAATVIQAHIRGFLVRTRLNRNKTVSSTSLADSDNPSAPSFEADPDPVRNKTILNIHIVPEGSHFLSRDESMLTSVELSLDGSPPASSNLHPLGYDKSERRKQLKREDAIQSISPPSNNSTRLSDENDSVKEVLLKDVKNETRGTVGDGLPLHSNICQDMVSKGTVEGNLTEDGDSTSSDKKLTTEISSDESDVITPYVNVGENNTSDSDTKKLLHSGEFHDVVLPTKVSRTDTSVVRGE